MHIFPELLDATSVDSLIFIYLLSFLWLTLFPWVGTHVPNLLLLELFPFYSTYLLSFFDQPSLSCCRPTVFHPHPATRPLLWLALLILLLAAD